MLSWMALSFISDHAASFSFGFSLKHSAEFLSLKLLCCSSFECFSRRKKAWHMNGSVLTLSLLLQWHLTVIQLICLPLTTKSTKDFFFKKNTFWTVLLLQQREWRQPLPCSFTYLFFSSSLGERGETSLRWHPPSCGNGFPGPLLCQLLAAVVLQSKRCRNPFSGQSLWLRMLPPPPLCVCVLLRDGDRVGMRGNELDSYAYDQYLFYLFRKRMHALLLALI